MATHKLQTNIAVVGTVKYMDYYPAKVVDGNEYSAQVALKGTWDGIGEAVIYLPQTLANDIIGAGLAQTNGEKVFQGQQVPQFKWLYQGRVQVLKAEEGRTKRTSVLAIDAAPTVAGAASPPPAVAAPVAQQSGPAPVRVPTGTPTPVPHTQVEGAWVALAEQYHLAMRIAVRTWGEQLEPTALVAAAATVFIEANKRGLKAEPVATAPADPRHLGAWSDMPAAIERGRTQDEAGLRF